VDYGRTPGPVQPDEALGYGAHWWLGMAGPGSFSANGYQGQYTLIVPEDDLIVVRNGRSPLEYKDRQRDWTAEIASCFKKAK
ncbi:MAG: serine hydrolase, partial [Henriciella sp.]